MAAAGDDATALHEFDGMEKLLITRPLAILQLDDLENAAAELLDHESDDTRVGICFTGEHVG